MSKRLVVLSALLLSLGLSACNEDTDETVTDEEVNETAVLDTASADSAEVDIQEDESEPELDESVEIEESQQDKIEQLNQLLKQAEKQYQAEQFDAAAGTLSKLFQYDLSEYDELAEKAENLKADIRSIQAEKADSTLQESVFKEERQSAILSEEFLTVTGQRMEDASDEDLADWISEKEAQAITDDSEREWTKEEAENYAFDQLMILEDLNYENYFFFVNMTAEDWVQLEAREAIEQDGVSWSNLIGLYRYNVYSDELQKLDTVTGEYETVQNPS